MQTVAATRDGQLSAPMPVIYAPQQPYHAYSARQFAGKYTCSRFDGASFPANTFSPAPVTGTPTSTQPIVVSSSVIPASAALPQLVERMICMLCCLFHGLDKCAVLIGRLAMRHGSAHTVRVLHRLFQGRFLCRQGAQ